MILHSRFRACEEIEADDGDAFGIGWIPAFAGMTENLILL
jgi:hypothetical protein